MALLVALGVLMAACSSDDGGDEAAADGGDGLAVSLSEWAVEAPSEVAGGSLSVVANNEGGEIHELVIVRADSVDGWEKDDQGKVLEDQFAAADFIGEIEEFDAGTTESATFDLDPGTYVLFCNIVEEEDDGSFESHFDEGMWTLLDVT